jgi:aryl-alcohol dehydrogenase-like predicted oxidoreductase
LTDRKTPFRLTFTSLFRRKVRAIEGNRDFSERIGGGTPMDFSEKRTLGRTGLKVGPLGVSSSFGAPAKAFEEAYERGCNYFYWGSMRKKGMRDAIRNIKLNGERDDLVLVIQSYSRSSALLQLFFEQALKALELDHADILLLGWHNKAPSPRVLDRAMAMKEKGLFRFLGLSGHHRPLFPRLADEGVFDLFHVRYNAAHRGAEREVFPHFQDGGRPGVVTYTATRWGQLLDPGKMPPGEPPASASDCYRFALSNPSVDVCITGPKDEKQMKEALRTLDLGPLSPEEMDRMRKIGDHVRAHSRNLFFR